MLSVKVPHLEKIFSRKITRRTPESTRSDGHVLKVDELPSIPENAKRETFRLASFNMCKIAVAPFPLAMAGFYRIGPGDRVQCFSCGNVVESWKSTDDVQSSVWHKEDCKHFLGQDSGNRKIGEANFESSLSSTSPTPTSVPSAIGKESRQNVGIYPPSLSSVFPPETLPGRNEPGPSFTISPPRRTLAVSSTIPASEEAAPTPSTMTHSVIHTTNTQPVNTPVVSPTIPQPRPVHLMPISSVYYPQHQMLLDNVALYREEDRRTTFTDQWPTRLSHLIDPLSKVGFFYLGNDDRTQCFSCGAVQKSWLPTDDVYAIHAACFPNCRMILHTETRNVPLHQQRDFSLESRIVKQPSSNLPSHVASSSGLQYIPYEDRQIEQFGLPHHSPVAGLRHPRLSPNLRATSSQPSTSSYVHPNDRSLQITGNINFETRLPSGDPANVGGQLLFSTTSSSSLPNSQQVHNSFPTRSLETSFVPVNQNRRFPQQPSSEILPQESVDLFSTQHTKVFPAAELDVGGFMKGDEKRLLQLTYKCDVAKCPDMVYISKRIETFSRSATMSSSSWPFNESISTITEVATAGFFYSGPFDHVKCWYCGVKAENWATKHNAWDIHARLFPSCHFLLRNRGPDFVEAVLTQLDDETESPAIEATTSREPFMSPYLEVWEGEGSRLQSGPERLPSPPIVDPGREAEDKKLELQRSMESDIVLSAFQMGFSRSHVRKVIKKQIEDWSCSFQTSEALIDALIDTPQDLIEFESDEEESPTSSNNNPGLSFEDLDDTVELYQSYESSLVNPTEDIETASNSNLPPQSSGQQASSSSQAHEPTPETPSVANVEEIREKLTLMRNAKRCKVCLDREATMVFLPCGHICACDNCTTSLRNCPICRSRISKAYKTYAP